MIDSNMDAVIQAEELSNALKETTGTQPPGWVINGLMSVLDMDKDGNVTVADLHTYFEAIGLPSGIEESPEPEADEFEELDKEIEEEARRQAEELIRQQEAEKQRLLEEELAREAAERLAEEQAKQVEAEKAKPKPIVFDDDGAPLTHGRFIELLGSLKLNSERRNAIEQSPTQPCKIQIKKVEKTLVGQGTMKNGITIIGNLVDDMNFEVELRLPVDATEQAMAFQMNHNIEAEATICDWNLGRQRAVLDATEFQYL